MQRKNRDQGHKEGIIFYLFFGYLFTCISITSKVCAASGLMVQKDHGKKPILVLGETETRNSE